MMFHGLRRALMREFAKDPILSNLGSWLYRRDVR